MTAVRGIGRKITGMRGPALRGGRVDEKLVSSSANEKDAKGNDGVLRVLK